MDSKDNITISKTELRELIREELAKHDHKCRFAETQPKDLEALKQYTHTVGSIGGGDISDGLDVMRDNHNWLKSQRERSGKLATAFMVCLVSTSTAGIITFIFAAVKKYLTKGG